MNLLESKDVPKAFRKIIMAKKTLIIQIIIFNAIQPITGERWLE